MHTDLIEHIDYYLDEVGRMVFTETYHLKRGYCCKNNCKHCPWKNIVVKDTSQANHTIKKLFLCYAISMLFLLGCNNQTVQLKQPESIVATDKYLYVSNVNGNPIEKDKNGYISKLYENGTPCETIFIGDLDAPKGLYLYQNILYVTDIDKILGFHIFHKKKVFELSLASYQTQFLNDICGDENGNLYISATDINKIFKVNISTKAIDTVKLSFPIIAPNGLFYSNRTLYYCEFGNEQQKGSIGKITFEKDSFAHTTLLDSVGYLDGISVQYPLLYFSDWVTFNEHEKVSKIGCLDLQTHQVTSIKSNRNMSGCSDLFFDNKNSRVIVPLMNENVLHFIGVFPRY